MWPWKDDMTDYYIYTPEDQDNGLVTNDFNTMRENIYHYSVNYGDGAGIVVESEKADVAVRIEITREANGKNGCLSEMSAEKGKLIINNQWRYPELKWGNYLGIPCNLFKGMMGRAVILLKEKLP